MHKAKGDYRGCGVKDALAVIVITAFDEAETRDRCLALGARRYFCKPVDGNELIEAIREL